MHQRQYPGPNTDVLEAQARVCTGPHQTRPLGVSATDPIQPEMTFGTILKSLRGEIAWEHMVSEAQMGAFFAAMTIRNYFPEETQWSEAEVSAFEQFQTDLDSCLPPDIKFIVYPNLGYRAANPQEEIVKKSLDRILRGEHLTSDETRSMGEAILNGQVKAALKGAALIGQRMNRETYDEVRGYMDSVFAPEQVLKVSVNSLTHFGEPYDGSTRYFKPTVFIAAVRAALGEASILHGVDEMPPKLGITEEKILKTLGARTNLPLEKAATLIEDSEVGFAYVSQREFSPGAYAIRELRMHIKKRPPWAATEKAQQLYSAGSNHMIVGYYHPGYEEPLLQLMWERGLKSGLVTKGEEGTSHYAMRLGKPSVADRKAINYTQGFKRADGGKQVFALDINPASYGFHYDKNPRLESVSAEAFAEVGVAALSGQKGHVYDRILLNTAIGDYLLGFYPDPQEAIDQTKDAIDSGRALAHLRAYIEKSNTR